MARETFTQLRILLMGLQAGLSLLSSYITSSQKRLFCALPQLPQHKGTQTRLLPDQCTNNPDAESCYISNYSHDIYKKSKIHFYSYSISNSYFYSYYYFLLTLSNQWIYVLLDYSSNNQVMCEVKRKRREHSEHRRVFFPSD